MLHILSEKLNQWLRIRRDTQRLRAVDDRLLADIGIDRREIGDLVRGRLH